MARKAIISIVAAVALFAACTRQSDNDITKIANLYEKEIRDLSYAIKAADSYRSDVRRQLDSLALKTMEAEAETNRCTGYIELSKRFRPINTDSALFYANRAKELAANLPISYNQKSDIAIIDALSTAGLFTAALENFAKLGEHQLEMPVRLDYWIAGRRLYGYMKSYTQGNREFYIKYDEKYRQYDDSLIKYLPANSDFRVFIECERLVTKGQYAEAQTNLQRLIDRLPQEDNLYGMAAFQMAEVYRNLNEQDKYAAMLALSALSDVKGCVTEGVALPTLADWLYQHGQLGDAFIFINFALEEATSGNARMRAVSIARFVPIIDHAYRDKINSSRDELMIYFLLVTILFILSIVLLIFLIRQIKKTKLNASKLAHTSRRQESYIANFIGLYSSYADRLNHLAQLVSTKLSAGQTAELKKLLDSGRFTDQDNDDIYKIFDNAFLDIYPDFINNINSLLKPEESFKINNEQPSLTPELRIYAFVKLGITESTRIAQILHYSINTVYTYRNKMRNKAINRDTFDTDVKNL